MKNWPRNIEDMTLLVRMGLAVLVLGLISFLPACAISTAAQTSESETNTSQTAGPNSGTGETAATPEEGSEQTTVSYLVPTITCPSCVARVKANAEKDLDVLDAQVKGQRVTVTYDPAKTDPEKIAGAIRKGGDTVLPDE